MNKAQKFLLDNNLDDIVLNEKQYPENTPENANKWIYLSDILEQYLEHNQALRIHDVVGRSEQLVCDRCKEQDKEEPTDPYCMECKIEIEQQVN